MSAPHQSEYDETYVAGLELLWGEGFMSPGGADELAKVLDGVDLAGREVLDIGSGTGGYSVLLAKAHGAARVVGVDVVPFLVERARTAAANAGVADRVAFELVEPGPLPHPDASFDVVFSKDAMLQIPDKPALYTQVLRVLRPGGLFVASDWLKGGDGALSRAVRDYIEGAGHNFALESPAGTRRALEAAGFAHVALVDRHAWYRDLVRQEVAQLAGPLKPRLVDLLGEAGADNWVASRERKAAALQGGELRPTHLRAAKPG